MIYEIRYNQEETMANILIVDDSIVMRNNLATILIK
jgi:PleD family two-component response regulator